MLYYHCYLLPTMYHIMTYNTDIAIDFCGCMKCHYSQNIICHETTGKCQLNAINIKYIMSHVLITSIQMWQILIKCHQTIERCPVSSYMMFIRQISIQMIMMSDQHLIGFFLMMSTYTVIHTLNQNSFICYIQHTVFNQL